MGRVNRLTRHSNQQTVNKLRQGGFSSYVVFDIGLHVDVAKNLLSSLHCQIVVQVEYSLLPVGIGGLRTWGRETGQV